MMEFKHYRNDELVKLSGATNLEKVLLERLEELIVREEEINWLKNIIVEKELEIDNLVEKSKEVFESVKLFGGEIHVVVFEGGAIDNEFKEKGKRFLKEISSWIDYTLREKGAPVALCE